MAPRTCPACGRALGSSAGCASCRDAAAGELAARARDITERDVEVAARKGAAFVARPPWYARRGASRVLSHLDLARRVLADAVAGRYRRLPWVSLAALSAAVLYVVSPIDLIPDFLVPIGWTDDLLVMALAWQFLRGDLRRYCEWKGIEPAEYGL